MSKNILLSVLCVYSSFSYCQYVGIGTTTPGSGLEVRGTGMGAQQRITDATSGNSLVLQGGPGASMKITGYNYGTGTAQPLYLSVDGANTFINPGNGFVGIGTTAPATRLTVASPTYGIEHTDGTRRLSTYLNTSGAWIGTISNHPLHFYTNDGSQQMTLTQSGQVGIGTTTPTGGYLLDIAGPVKTFGNTTHFVAQTTGGTNSWARLYMRSTAQSWFMGTSQNYSGNQLYIGDETFNHTRFSIQPNNGPIYMQGNITQNTGAYGMPKAMVLVNGDGAIIRCYNGITGSTSGGCGISASRLNSGYYQIAFPFDISNGFISLTLQGFILDIPVGISYFMDAPGIKVQVFEAQEGGPGIDFTDRPFMVIVY